MLHERSDSLSSTTRERKPSQCLLRPVKIKREREGRERLQVMMFVDTIRQESIERRWREGEKGGGRYMYMEFSDKNFV